ncbi:hypothetical protein P7C71_g3753, partial [Lecanoromycetidae sp. Uapishka_2]
MNPNNFQTMGQARPQPVGQPPIGMQKNGSSTSSEIRSHIFKALSNYPVPVGWQQTVAVHQRVAHIHQMVTGLLILKPEMPQAGAVNVAVGFETQEFSTSPDLAAQMGLTQQQMTQQMAQNQNHFQQGFGIPQPQPSGPAVPTPMQQQFSQQQRSVNPNDMQQQVQNVQAVQGMPRPMPQTHGPPQFTQQELQYITNIARQMVHNMSEQEKQNYHAQVRNFSPQQVQNMQMQGLNPVQILIRNTATRRYLEERSKRQQQSGQVPAPLRENAMATQGRPTSQVAMHAQSQQLPPASAPQQTDPNFAPGNMDQFLGQQAEALRHQAAGQDVVPASHVQGAPPQVRGTPQVQQQSQFAVNRAPQAQNNFQPHAQPFYNTPQPPQQNLQQNSQLQAQPPAPSFTNVPAQPSQQHGLQGQVGGLGNNQAQRTPQQVHNMPTLNQPLDLPGQKQKDQAQRATQPPQKPNQRNVATTSTGPQPATASSQPHSNQQRQQPNPGQAQWNNFPEPIRTKLLSMPEEHRKQWLAQMIQRQRQQAAGNANAATKPDTGAQPNAQVAPLGPKGNHTSNPQASNTPMPSATQQSAMGQSNLQFPGDQQPPQFRQNRAAPPKVLPIDLNIEQIQLMDNLRFPPNIMNRGSELGKLPENVQTWRQLKEHIRRNTQTLPPGSMQKVMGLQSLQFQAQFPANQQRAHMAQQVQQGNSQLPQAGVAPVGQMVPQGNQGLRQAPPMLNSFGFSSMPETTAQDLQAVRNTLQPHMRHITDDQLSRMIKARKQQEFFKTPQGQQALAMQQQRNSVIRAQLSDTPGNQQPAPQTAPGQMPQPSRAQNQSQQPVHPQNQQQQPPRPTTQPPKPNQGAWAGVRPDPSQTSQKGTKRNNNNNNNNSDDVVEVPDPKLAQQQTRPPPNLKAPPPPQTTNGQPKLTQEQYNSLNPEQKAQWQRRMQALQALQRQRTLAQQNGSNAPPRTAAESAPVNTALGTRDPKFQQLWNEVAQSTPPRPIVPMSPQTRSVMVEKLKSTGNMVQRVEESVPIFLHVSKDEDRVKDLLRIRLHLLQQVQDRGFTKPVDNFTMSLKELEEYKKKIHAYFAFMAEKQGQMGKGKPVQQPLNAANLQQQQDAINLQRAASVQKSHAANNRAPAAPTTAQPPFPFGSPSPQGVPQMYAPNKNELTQEKLVLPNKRRKNNNNQASPASTPAQSKGTPVTKSSPLPKPPSPAMQRAPAVAPLAKCPVEGCNMSGTGFATKEELDKHKLEAHDPTHNIKDPMDAALFAIESMRIVLDLDENGKCKPVPQEMKREKGLSQAPVMKTTMSSQGIKQEVATPMSRNPTQTGPSPSTQLLKTPQATTNVKTPVSETKSLIKGAATSATSAPTPAKEAVATDEVDGWVHCKVEKGWFREVFGGCASLNRSVSTEAKEAYLTRNPFTPPETDSSAATSKESPHRSDISPNDNLNVNLGIDAGEIGDEWVLTQNWFDDGLQDEMADLNIPDLGDPMEWEKAFETKDENKDDEKLQNNEWDAPVEFLKAYDPEKYESLKKKQKEKEAPRRR